MHSELTQKEFLVKTVRFLFSGFFILWIVLALLELIMPGFVIYYFNMNWLLVAVLLLGVVNICL